MNYLEQIGIAAVEASTVLSQTKTDQRNKFLKTLSELLIENSSQIISNNKKDIVMAKKNGRSAAYLERLFLDINRIEKIANNIKSIITLPDPINEIFDKFTAQNGLIIEKIRIPLGVIGSIYESRPEVTIDIASLSIKSGNTCILRGGSDSINSNNILTTLCQKALGISGLPQKSVQLITNLDRAEVSQILEMDRYIDLIIPRGNANLISFVKEKAKMPVITGGIGVCHIFVDKDANIDKAMNIIENAKIQKPSACNAVDTILLHKNILDKALPKIIDPLIEKKVELRCDQISEKILSKANYGVVLAKESDWGKEFLSLILAIKVVNSFNDAIQHIEKFGSGHSEAIITENQTSADKFLKEVDSAAVYVNASTRFTDGFEFGLGAEVGISTDKLHARGPMGLKELTSYKWLIHGKGQIRS